MNSVTKSYFPLALSLVIVTLLGVTIAYQVGVCEGVIPTQSTPTYCK